MRLVTSFKITILTLLISISVHSQELSPIDEVTEFIGNNVWVNNMTCYGDSCVKNRQFEDYYYWNGIVNDYYKDSILFYSFYLTDVYYTRDSITERKTPVTNKVSPMLVLLSKDELEYPTYNCLYKSEHFSGFVELKTNKNVFVLKGLFNDDTTIVTLHYKKVSPPPKMKELMFSSKESK